MVIRRRLRWSETQASRSLLHGPGSVHIRVSSVCLIPANVHLVAQEYLRVRGARISGQQHLDILQLAREAIDEGRGLENSE